MVTTHAMELPILIAADLDFSHATLVISAAQKFVIPIPAFGVGGEPLVYPDGDRNAGNPIIDWQGNPIGERGIVFWNDKDKAWQAALGDGITVIIMNDVTEAQAARLYDRYIHLGDPLRISVDMLKEFLGFASTELGIVDMYNSERRFIADHMTAVDSERFVFEIDDQTFGFLKRDARDVSAAIFVDGRFLFDMQEASRPAQRMEDGGVIVALPNPTGAPSIHAVHPEVFLKTYRLADAGTKITRLRTQIQVVSVSDLAVSAD